ncbi:MAG: hypothetical protein K8J31_05920 [Anaerolineae bacterium]|nr:hypothetical protein [Anaerolineae bacterium]
MPDDAIPPLAIRPYPIKLTDRISHQRLVRTSFIDYTRAIILVAERRNPRTGEGEIIAASHLCKLHGCDTSGFTLVISDAWHNKGLGTEILLRQMEIARVEDVHHLQSTMLSEADHMRHIFEKYG